MVIRIIEKWRMDSLITFSSLLIKMCLQTFFCQHGLDPEHRLQQPVVIAIRRLKKVDNSAETLSLQVFNF